MVDHSNVSHNGESQDVEICSSLSRRKFLLGTCSVLTVLALAAGAKTSNADTSPFYVPGAFYPPPSGQEGAQGLYRPIGLSIVQTSMVFSPILPPAGSVGRGEEAMILTTFEGVLSATDVAILTSDNNLIELTQGLPNYGKATKQIVVKLYPKSVNNKVAGISHVGVPIGSPNFITLTVIPNNDLSNSGSEAFSVVANA